MIDFGNSRLKLWYLYEIVTMDEGIQKVGKEEIYEVEKVGEIVIKVEAHCI